MVKPIVNTSNGKVQGFVTKNLEDEDFYAFLGIPYGKDPIGNLRFKAPEPVENWNGVKDCTKDGPRCIQIDLDEGDHIRGSEHCLNLNIYTRSSFERFWCIFAPTVEAPNRTAFITEEPLDMILNGKFPRVPILATYTDKEGLLTEISREIFIKQGKELKPTYEAEDILLPWYKNKMNDTDFSKISLEVKRVYFSSSESKMLLESDVNFIMPQIAISQTHALFSDKPVYLMRWSVSDELNYMKFKFSSLDLEGCGHADEIGYIFKLRHMPVPKKGSSAYTIVRRTAQIFKNFCLYGNPSTDFTGNWKPLQEASTHVLDFGKDVAFVPFPEAERMKLWQKIMDFDKRDAKLSSLKVV